MTDLARPLLNDHVLGTVWGPNGPQVRPTTLLSPNRATIIRAYFAFALRAGLEPELICTLCDDGTRASRTVYNIAEDDLQIICACRMLYFVGETPYNALAACWAGPETVRQDGKRALTLSAEAVERLRAYKLVLQAHALKEALRCNRCFELNQSDGCEAHVLSTSIRIDCRCTERRHVGVTH